MTTTQAYVDAQTARELVKDLGRDFIVGLNGDEISIDFGEGAETFATLEDAVTAIRENAKH